MFSRLSKSLPLSRFFRQFEQDAETVVRILQPGPLGIVEHKFSAEENLCKAIKLRVTKCRCTP